MKAPSRQLTLIGLIGVQFIWAISYILSKILTNAFPPMIWASIRSAITAFFLVVLALALKRPHPKPTREFFFPLFLFALLGGVLTQAFFLTGLHYTSSTESAILNTLTPLITILTVTLIGWEEITPFKTFGALTSFIGVLILSRVEEFQLSSQSSWGNFLTFLNCICYGIFLAISKSFFSKYDRIWITAWMLVFTSICLTLITYPQFSSFEWPQMSLPLWGAALYSVFISTMLGYFMVVWVVANAPASEVALFEYFQPILASGLAWAFLQEHLTGRTLVGGLLIAAGVGISSRKWISQNQVQI